MAAALLKAEDFPKSTSGRLGAFKHLFYTGEGAIVACVPLICGTWCAAPTSGHHRAQDQALSSVGDAEVEWRPIAQTTEA